MRRIALCLSLSVAVSATPVVACRVPIPEAKFRISDAVVDGVAYCLRKKAVCRLQVVEVRKGSKIRKGRRITIAVTERPKIQASGDEIIVGFCPQTFEPDEAVNRGRFYLKARADGSWFAFLPPDLQETGN